MSQIFVVIKRIALMLLIVSILWGLFTVLKAQVPVRSEASVKRHRPSGPFPLISKITDLKNKQYGEVHTYPEYAEVYDTEGKIVLRLGKISDKGVMKIYIIGQGDELGKIKAFAFNFGVYDVQGRLIGSFYNTPTFSYIYSTEGDRLGRIKCLAWANMCASATSYMLNNALSPPKS